MPPSNLPSKETLVEQIKQQMETDPELQKWFDQYRKLGRDSFIDRYAHTKSIAMHHPTLYLDEFKPMNKEFNDLARLGLELIQQKKLFNIQCEWRAKQLHVPFINVAYDFEIVGRKHLMEFPFLPPVTFDEVELLIQFLKSPEAQISDFEHYDEWQDYDAIREEDETGEFSVTPPWYEFYDSRHGTGYLLRLPNIKGDKEDHYMAVAREHDHPNQTPYVPDPDLQKPALDYYSSLIDYARRFEPQETAEIVISHIKMHEHRNNHEILDQDYEYLKMIPDDIPFVEHPSWRESLSLTVEQYRLGKIADALPRVWRMYHKDVGDDPEAYVNRRMAKSKFQIVDDYGVRKFYIDRILKGRELLGEPQDFDY